MHRISNFVFLADIILHVQPSSVAVCAGGSATFTCTVSYTTEKIDNVGWQILNMGGNYTYVFKRDRHILTRNNGAVLIENLTIINVTTADNGTLYRCKPIPIQLFNNTVYLTVAGRQNTLYACIVYIRTCAVYKVSHNKLQKWEQSSFT